MIAVVFAVVPVIICRVQTGKFDLMKTLEAAEDVAHAVEDLDEGIKKIEELRGKKLSKKMSEKEVEAAVHSAWRLFWVNFEEGDSYGFIVLICVHTDDVSDSFVNLQLVLICGFRN